mmetsp:Transcript_8013/g.14919  ORF Transcript_8013/g.14919 Transcript_8013/m.14919 type:complete len:287 (+) Transcript_8013:202-1062(+)
MILSPPPPFQLFSFPKTLIRFFASRFLPFNVCLLARSRDGSGREEDGVDDLNDTLAGPHVSLHDGRVAGLAENRHGCRLRGSDRETKGVDRGIARRRAGTQRGSFQERWHRGPVREVSIWHDIPDDVVLEDLLQEVRLSQDLLRGGVCRGEEGIESGVRWCEHGHLLGNVIEGIDQAARVQRGDEGGEVSIGCSRLGQGRWMVSIDALVHTLVVRLGLLLTGTDLGGSIGRGGRGTGRRTGRCGHCWLDFIPSWLSCSRGGSRGGSRAVGGGWSAVKLLQTSQIKG